MKKLLFNIILLLIFLESCSSRFSKNKNYGNELYVGYIPNIMLLDGAFINDLDPTHDTLVLGPGLMFSLLTKDSLGNSQIIKGKWYEGPASDHPATNGHGNMQFYPEFENIGWACRVEILDSSAAKFLLLDKLSQNYSFYSRKLLNSNGRPYRFVRKLIKIDRKYY